MNFGKPKSVHRLSSAIITKRPDQMVVEKKLASHVPDLVVFNENRDNIPHVLEFNAVLLFADVSGFTALTEKYTLSSEKGTDALTVTLNNYIGNIVKYILKSGGDVLKFAGDAILAAWKVKTRADLKFAISQVARCSLIIQENCDKQDTDVGVQLRVKIAISAGKTYATFVGNDISQHIVMSGRPVREVNVAEKYCEAGLVVLSPNAMELSDKEVIITSDLENRFALVKYLRRDPKKHWDQYVDYPFQKVENLKPKHHRLALNYPPDSDREQFIRKYVAAVVQKKLDDDQPLNFLSEMRQCSIIFINLDFDLNEKDRSFYEKQSSTMQTVFTIIYKYTIEKQGAINKIFMFDKGCTFLIIFGLPGNKHEQEPAHALQVSWKISEELHRVVSSLTLLSFGITTGPVFCGVVGHEERHEYTVIGQKVNLAARLMIYYPDKISCDFETYHDSKLSKEMFKKLPQKLLKGIGIVAVYSYTEGTRKSFESQTVIEPKFPIIGRTHEIELFIRGLSRTRAAQNLDNQRVIVVEGEAGYGKSRIMKEFEWRATKDGFCVISYMLSINDVATPYFTVKALLEILLNTYSKNFKVYKSRERRLLDMLGTKHSKNLCLVNELLDVNFPYSNEVIEMSDSRKILIAHQLLRALMDCLTSDKFVLFSLDDAQNIDGQSWEYLQTLCQTPKILTLMALRPFSPDKPPCDAAKQVIYNSHTAYIKLPPLMNEDLAPLACQFLRVKRIPHALTVTLIQRSHGVPLWCEHLLREMQNAGVLSLVALKHSEDNSHVASVNANDSGVKNKRPFPNISTIKETFSKSLFFSGTKARRIVPLDTQSYVGKKVNSPRNRSSGSTKGEKPMECIIKPNFDLAKFPIPASMRGMALARLDRMKSFEQVLVKSAAVIGICCSRQMLKAIVPGFGEKKFRQAIYQLMLSHVFECASKIVADKVEVPKKQTDHVRRRSYRLTCYCTTNYGDLSEEAIAAKCEQFRFHNSLLKETAYKLWLQDQRKTLHESCAYYLESKVNEILTTNLADPVVIKQYQLLYKYSAFEQLSRSKDSILKTSTSFQKIPEAKHSSQSSNFSNIASPSRNSTDEYHVEEYSSFPMMFLQNLPEPVRRRASLLSTSGKTFDDSQLAPLEFKEKTSPLLSVLSSKDYARAELEELEETSESPSVFGSRVRINPAWSKALNIPLDYEKFAQMSEKQARKLPATTTMHLQQTSYETHKCLGLFYQQLVHHWRNAKDTEKTLLYLLKTSESKIATRSFSWALFYLRVAGEIVENLSKGRDIVANVVQSEDPYDGSVKKVYQVAMMTKARIHKLTGQALFQQGKFEASLSCFIKALKILNCRLPNTLVGIICTTWYESYFQRLHLKNPKRYIGNSSYIEGYQYVKQVQCLGYIWQLLIKLKKARYRNKLARLVVYKQVNKAECSDFDSQELVTSYIYMTQLLRFDGDLLKSAMYEQKAFSKCAQLAKNPSTSNLYVISRVHLVCSSFRLCHGHLESALVAAYRAYTTASYLADVDMKLIVLPLLVEMHLLTGRGQSCVESLMYLKNITKSYNDVGVFSYYLCCFNIILDGGFTLEPVSNCIEYLENVEQADVGEVQFFCASSLLAAWYTRLNDNKAKDIIKLAAQSKNISYESYFAVQGYSRLVEAYVVHLQARKNSEKGLSRIKIEITCNNVLRQFKKLCVKFPVFYSRYLHYLAYYKCIYKNKKKAEDILNQSIQFAATCGNFTDHQWANHSKIVWFTDTPLTSTIGKSGYWLSHCNTLTSWEAARQIKCVERSYILKVQ